MGKIGDWVESTTTHDIIAMPIAIPAVRTIVAHLLHCDLAVNGVSSGSVLL